MPLSIATWNVNSVRARADRLRAWLERHRPDVACLQETKVVDEDFPAEVCTELGYHVLHRGQKAYNGVAILAREPLEDCSIGFDDGDLDEQSRLVAATVFGVRVISVYIPNGQAVGSEKYAYKLRWLERLRTHLDERYQPTQPLALCGDYNVTIDDRDVYDPQAWAGDVMCSEPERVRVQALADWGLRDVLRMHHEEGGLFTWWDYRRLAFQKGRGARIDHVYVTAPLAARSTGVVIDRDERKGKLPSDHAPVIAMFGD